MAIDIETRGTLPFANPRVNYIVGVGFADSRGSIYFHLPETNTSIYHQTFSYILERLQEYKPRLLAHNVAFEGPWLMRYCRDYRLPTDWLSFYFCTYALYKLIAAEGWAGQSWGLKSAMGDLLGWEETNEIELDMWLLNHDYASDWKIELTEKQIKGGEYYWIESKQRYGKPEKGEMWRVPYETLGHYCCLDVDSTWSIYTYVFKPVLERFPMLHEFSQRFFMKLEEVLARSMLNGINIDKEGVEWYQAYIIRAISESTEAFVTHPDVAGALVVQKQLEVDKVIAKEPARLKKNGDVSKNWLKWEEKVQEAQATPNYFNLNSFKQKSWLFYDMLKYPIKVWTLDDEGNQNNPSVDGDALKGFGESGKILLRQQELVKEEGYVSGCIEYIKHSEHGNILHPQFRVPGTLTGRLAGSGGLNVQQIPKTPGYLETWKPRPGKVWVDCDWTALEPVVVCALSRDEAMMKLYGPDAKPNDIYLFNGSHYAVIGPMIRATGYNPDNPTKEMLSYTKKVAKRERAISKTVTLASQYGAGAGKIQNTLSLDGIEITIEEAKAIHSSHHKLYKGVKEYENWLLRFWEASGGWVPNIVGRPIGVDAGYTKDLMNRVVQSSGHDLHVVYVYFLEYILKSRGIKFEWVIPDFHDQAIIEVDAEIAEECVQIMGTEAVAEVNDYVDCDIKFKMNPQIVYNMAEAKIESEEIEQWQIKKANLLSK